MVDDESEPESAKGSNSFGGDSDSAMSTYDEAKLQPEYAKPYLFNMPSTSSDYTHYSLGSSKDTLASLSGGHPPTHRDGLQASEEEHREFGNHVDYNCLEYGESIEQCTDKELEDILYSNGVNPNTYVLSSGRWEVNQGNLGLDRKCICVARSSLYVINWSYLSCAFVWGVRRTIPSSYCQSFLLIFICNLFHKGFILYLLVCGEIISLFWMQMLNQALGNQPLIKNSSSTFPCLCCSCNYVGSYIYIYMYLLYMNFVTDKDVKQLVISGHSKLSMWDYSYLFNFPLSCLS